MTYQSTWRRAYAGAKVTAVAGVVAGLMAFSAPAQATTYSTHSFQGYVFDLEGVEATNTLFAGDLVQASLQVSLAEQVPNNTANSAFLEITAGESLTTLKFTNQLPQSDTGIAPFVNPRVGFFDTSAGGVGTLIPELGSVALSTTLLAGETIFLFWSWDGLKNGLTGGILQSQITASVVPLPAALVLFLSGLAGIGFLGRYNAKRRREEPATA